MASIRLCENSKQLIKAGLAWTCARHRQYVRDGSPDSEHLDRRTKSAVYDARLMQRLFELHQQLCRLKPGARFNNLSSCDLAALALAVRVAVLRVKHGHTSHGSVARAKRLLERLEAARKRTKRGEIKQVGHHHYTAQAERWRDFVSWLRVRILDCACLKKRRRPPMTVLRYYRFRVRQLTAMTIAELHLRQVHPDEAAVRRSVRTALRYVRRGRRPFGVRTLSEHKQLSGLYLADFFMARSTKKTPTHKEKPQ